MDQRIEKQVELNAPIERVWRALTDFREFGEWFRVALEKPFAVGQISRGHITYPGYEHVVWEAHIETMEPPRAFAFTWPHVKSLEAGAYVGDYTGAPRTLVEFRLEKTATGTLLTVTESGFGNVPEDWRPEAFRRNQGGWSEQMNQIKSYVTHKP